VVGYGRALTLCKCSIGLPSYNRCLDYNLFSNTKEDYIPGVVYGLKMKLSKRLNK
jgi:hypothetical protein